MSRQRKPSNAAILHFTERLSALLPSGITLLKALQILQKQPCKKKHHLPITPLIDALEQGQALSLATHQLRFPNTYSQLLAVGESTGQLTAVLQQLHTLMLQQAYLKRMWMKALLYPLIVLCVALGITAVLLIWVIPKIEGMFTSFGQELPMMTQIVLNASAWVRANSAVMVLTTVVTYALLWAAIKKNPTIRYQWHRLSLKLPIVGSFLQLKLEAQTFQILFTCLSAGLTLDKALELSANASANLCYQQAFRHAHANILIGKSLSQSLHHHRLLSEDTLQLIAVAEDSAQLTDMFHFLSERSQNQLDHQLQQLSQLLEPLLMLFMGVIVGGLVIAMYLPVFTMGGVV